MTTIEARILRRAAELIRTNGWFQKKQKPHENAHCAYTAINDAALDLVPPGGIIASIDRAEDALRTTIGSNSIKKWNDAAGRTKEEVIATLRKAAKHEDQN